MDCCASLQARTAILTARAGIELADLRGANFTLVLCKSSNFTDANIEGVIFHKAELHCDLSDLNYDHLPFAGQDLSRCMFSSVDLSGRDLRD